MGQVAELRLPPAKPHHRIDGQKLKVGSCKPDELKVGLCMLVKLEVNLCYDNVLRTKVVGWSNTDHSAGPQLVEAHALAHEQAST